MVAAKICGLTTPEAVAAAAAGGAAAVGFVLFPPSPRHLALPQAQALVAAVPAAVLAVAVLVDPDDALLDAATRAGVGALQLHGAESPARVAEARAKTGLPVWKGVGVASAGDVAAAIAAYGAVADRLLLDARAPPGAALPGGNGLSFDPAILRGAALPAGWILSGGLTAATVAAAARGSGATMVDVSSGVEQAPGVKSLEMIAAFLEAASRA